MRGKTSKCYIFVTEYADRDLCGRDLIDALEMDLGPLYRSRRVQEVSAKLTLEEVLQENSEVFRPELGTYTKHSVSLKSRGTPRPRIVKTRSVPYSLKPAVERWLDEKPSRDRLRSEETMQILCDVTLEKLPITAERIAVATRSDKVLAEVMRMVTGEKKWPAKCSEQAMKAYFQRRLELTVHKGCLLWNDKVVIPDEYREKVLKMLHDDHMEMVRMKCRTRECLWFPGITRAITSIN